MKNTCQDAYYHNKENKILINNNNFLENIK